MKLPQRTLLLASVLIAPFATGQSGGDGPLDEAGEIVHLSPFVVSAQADRGYQALNTLAGTRLNTPLKDLGASISIYTPDFMSDIGAVDAATLLSYATNMEVAGASGNFSGATNDINSTMALNGGQRENPQGSGTRTRGLSAPNFTRNYFTTNIAFDAYNTGPVTVARGPNAILFGVGSPAGVIETSLISADLARTRTRAAARYGNNDSLRFSLDHNQVLVPQKLAFRLAALDDREEYNQRPAFEHKRRLFGTLTIAPYRSTEIKASFETGHTDASRPIGILPFNSISDAWYAAGRTGFDWGYYDDPARNPNARTQAASGSFYPQVLGVNLIADQIMLVYNNPTGSPTRAFRSTIPNTSGSAANAIRNALYHPLVNRDLAGDSIQFLSTRNIFELPAAYWTADRIPAGQQPGYAPAGIRYQGFTDYSVFNFGDQMIDETGRQGDSFHTMNVTLRQTAWDERVGVELAYDSQRYDRFSNNRFFQGSPTSHIRIDATATLPTGEANPNYGRPYVSNWESTRGEWLHDREAIRATVFLKYDFTQEASALRWLGRHTLTGLVQREAHDSIYNNTRFSSDGDVAKIINGNISVTNRRTISLVYLGPSLIGNDNPLSLSPIRVDPLSAGPVGLDATYFARAAGTTDAGNFASAPLSLTPTFVSGSMTREIIDSKAISLHSYWLADHLITLAGFREDRDYFANQSTTFVADPTDANAPGKSKYGFADMPFASRPNLKDHGTVGSFGVIARWPQRWLKLPQGSDLSVFYNQSENFTPAGSRVDGYGNSLPSPQGETREVGVQVWALDDKISVRLNKFETKVVGQSFLPGVFNVALNSTIMNIADAWAVEGNNNPHLVELRNSQIERLFSALPANYRALYNWKVEGAIPTLSISRDYSLLGATDTTDYTSKGYELDVVFNPSRGLRLMANVARQETVLSNMAPFLKEHIARMTPIWDELADVPRGGYPLGWQIGDPLPANVERLGRYVDTNVMVPWATVLAGEGVVSAEQRKWRANVVASYSFGQNGPALLKGFSVGAGVRWQDKVAIGYPTTRAPDGSVVIAIDNPYYAPAQTNVDGWIGYERRVFKNRVHWKVQLNARNLIGETSPIAISAQPWGEVASARIAPERRWYLTNTFSF